ncbi:EF-hand domain-containing protein [Actimicrobium sp. CCI2.3]|uniref:EF-hand domain-containing protein n=1 Tax=Actimicrobium sp. CCI2.3 TaxID=3048616 RepID=UPI002AB4770A|nr:EF-hand domain-containing protein [Actimicrobium sp. CCI2.3]MDY7573822.1 EF-hand domain-containing protein [Actimicrobium sp. CCI2.3]MEB0022433.1 EF-hand domain-containing protein [Actimicrobium sp. CCI2.3]
MKNLTTSLIAGALLCISSATFAASHTAAPSAPMSEDGAKPMMHKEKDGKHMAMMMEMDTNGDGMISKEEFMKHHEKMFDAMPKNKDGLVDLKAMHAPAMKK